MGTGQIRKRNGTYFLRIYVGKKRRELSLGSVQDLPSKKQRETAADNIRLRLGIAGTGARTTLERFAEFWFLPVADGRLRQSTAKDYRWRFNHYIKGRKEARLPLWEYRTRDVQNLLNGIAFDFPHLSKASMQRNKALLSAIFRHSVVAGFREGNPVRDVLLTVGKRPSSEEGEAPAPKPEPAVYDLAVIRKVLKQPLPGDLRCAVALAALSGLRLAELNGLRWEDIDWEANAISVTRSVWQGHENEPKSKASKASVPIIPELRTHLLKYRNGAQATGPLFTADVKALGRYHLPDAFTAVKSEWHGWHGFRRGLASTLFAAGAEDLVVQRVLRHSKVIVTREHYIRRFDQRVLDAMNTLSRKQGASRGRAKRSTAKSPVNITMGP